MFGGSDFSRVERNFTIGQSPKIWGNFSKIFIKIKKKIEQILKKFRKMQIFQKFFNLRAGHKFFIMGKIKYLIWTCYLGWLGGRSPEGRINFRKFVEIGNVKFNNFTKIA